VEAPIASVLGDRYLPTGRVLGAGGMGRVLEARDHALHRNVAVKVLNRELAADPGVRRRFAHEAVAAASLNHRNVVCVFDVGIDADPPFIVMELLPGDTVADGIARGPVEPRIVRRVGLEMLAALEHAHRAGVIHRDIKPGNVLLDERGTAKVADFGIAKSLGADITRTRELLGTPCYLAPEILSGAAACAQTDVYAAGVTLYEMLTSRKPFASDTPWATLAAIQRGERPPLRELLPDVDPGLEAVIERAMAPDPANRFRSAAEMEEALAAIPLSGSTSRGSVDPTPAARIVDLDALDRIAPPPPADATRRLEFDPTTISLGRPAVTLPEPWWRRRLGLVASAVLAILAGIALLFAAAVSGDGTSPLDRNVGTVEPTPGAESDPALERALRELEEAVQP